MQLNTELLLNLIQEYDKKHAQFVNVEADLLVAKSRVSALEQANRILGKLK